jgi:hypothetical protein
MYRIPNGIEFALEVIDEFVKSFLHHLVDIQELKLGSQATEELLRAIMEVPLVPSRDLQ